jgi:transposase
MSETREFGTIISGNRRRNCEFSPVQRSAICAKISEGKSYRAVATEFNTSPSTAHAIFKRWKNDHTVDPKPRKGRPKKLTPAEVRYITIMIKKNRRITWNALVGAMNGQVSRRTLQRALQKEFRRKWKAINRIPLSEETAASRLSFARAWKDNVEELMAVWLFKICPLDAH